MFIDLPMTPARDARLLPVSTTTTVIDATTTQLAQVFRVTKSGTIKYIRFFPTITSAGNLIISLLTVTTNMVPTTTNFATNTFVTMTPTTNTWNLATMTGNAVVAKGDLIAVQFRWSGTAGNIAIASQTTYSPTIMQTFASSTWTKQSNKWLSLAIGYSDGSWPPDISLPVRTSTSQLASTTTGEFALRWTPDKNFRLGGVLFYGYLAADASFLVYDSSGSTTANVLLTQAMPANHVTDATDRLFHIDFSTSLQLVAGTTYWLTLLPASTNNSRFYTYSVDQNAKEAIGYGTLLTSYAGRSIGGSWSAPNDAQPSWIPVYSGVAVPNGFAWNGGFN